MRIYSAWEEPFVFLNSYQRNVPLQLIGGPELLDFSGEVL